MPIPFPYPAYGRLYDSNGAIVASGNLYFTSGVAILHKISNSGGKYAANIMNYAYSGGNVTIRGLKDGEKFSDSYKVIISSMGINKDIHLTEANSPGKISINTYKNHSNKIYIFDAKNNNSSWCKTVDG